MAGLSQTQSLSQQQVLAPQLQQSLQILQAPMLELRNLIQQELCTNPTIEEDEMEPTIEDKKAEHDEFQEEFDRLSKLDEEWREYMSQSASYSGRSAEDEERRQFFFDSIVGVETLQQHLLEQVNGSELNASDRQLAELIVGNIDDKGFLQTSPEEIAQNTGMDVAELTRVLEFVQTFHPVGVGSRDLRECLLIQLRRLSKEQSLEYRIVDRHLEDLGKRRFPEIARRLGTTVEQVQRAANFVATLDPKPGQIFTPDPNNYVLPDVTVEKIGGDWTISLNGEQIPHLRISNTYKDLMSQEKGGADVKDYIRDKIRSGKFLIKSIHQRQQTISNIAHEIVAKQKEFLKYGPSALKPLTMVQIADIVGVHETTVSRAISGKYMATPHGVFDMKYFFTPGYQTADGASMSNTSVKGTIAELVKAEDSKNPLSDKEIVELLEKRGIPIARRTVAKYRGELNILPSNMRKRYDNVITEAVVREKLASVKYPGFSRDIVSFGLVKSVRVEGDSDVFVQMAVATNDPRIPQAIKSGSETALAQLPGVGQVTVRIDIQAPPQMTAAAGSAPMAAAGIDGIRHIIAIASGKGGVGKSTVAANLAVAFQQTGAAVGLCDCDLYGPSIGLMFGCNERPMATEENRILPIERHGLKLMSMGFLLDDAAPAILRGPMVTKYTQQFLRQVEWGALDYLVLDLPPGTGDIQLTIVQTVALAGAVIVTTPQEVALIDARKAATMFQKVNVPVLGLVENMSYFLCPSDGKRYDIFGAGGGEREAARLKVPLLGQIPIDIPLRESGDRGVPVALADPANASSRELMKIARTLVETLS